MLGCWEGVVRRGGEGRRGRHGVLKGNWGTLSAHHLMAHDSCCAPADTTGQQQRGCVAFGVLMWKMCTDAHLNSAVPSIPSWPLPSLPDRSTTAWTCCSCWRSAHTPTSPVPSHAFSTFLAPTLPDRATAAWTCMRLACSCGRCTPLQYFDLPSSHTL